MTNIASDKRKKIDAEKKRQAKTRERRAKGMVPRAEWLSKNSMTRLKPWKLLGIGRTKFYELPAAEREAARLKAEALHTPNA